MTHEDYNPAAIEEKWQARWHESNADVCRIEPDKPKYYVLEMLPYPSGSLHMGHVRNYSIGDVIARCRRMQGFNVMHPMGWDAFGLPAENAAIKHRMHPARWTYANIDSMRAQLKRLGYSYDWTRENATCRPEYYRWEQMFFLRMWEKGLVYRKKAPQNWCPSCHTVLANEQVIDGKCWRCDSEVRQKELAQWFLRITAYADELLNDLESLAGGWPERVLTMQRNWIGKSEGANVRFALECELDGEKSIQVFTTRPDTLYGVTFLTLAPEHPLTEKLAAETGRSDMVSAFVGRIRQMDRMERQAEDLEKEGVFTGAYAIHPLSGEKIPVWLGNFVLAGYGTGAVMGVPAHDQRDLDFARKYDLPVKVVIEPDGSSLEAANMTEAYSGHGRLANSNGFDGMANEPAKSAITGRLEELGLGERSTQFRLRDWNISRQRYWGAPIPVVYCPNCGPVPEKEENLPIVLPMDAQIHDDGRSPLPECPSFMQCECPRCGSPARRETDTMDTFVESSWYFSRYVDARNENEAVSQEALEYWMPVDQYIGGVEHAILHLLYSRFFTKALRDLGLYPKKLSEPFSRLLTQGMVLKDGSKMSKSRGNIVDPTEMIEKYGADTVRLFCLFAAPPERDFDWSQEGIQGAHRFLGRVWRLFMDERQRLLPASACSSTAEDASDPELRALRRKEHLTVKKATEDMSEKFQFNTAIAAVMELVNMLCQAREKLDRSAQADRVFSSALASAVTLLYPCAPHVCDELWERMGHAQPLGLMPWPVHDESALAGDMLTIAVQVNGKLRSTIHVPATVDRDALEKGALADPVVQRHMQGREARKIIVVPGRLVNIVTG